MVLSRFDLTFWLIFFLNLYLKEHDPFFSDWWYISWPLWPSAYGCYWLWLYSTVSLFVRWNFIEWKVCHNCGALSERSSKVCSLISSAKCVILFIVHFANITEHNRNEQNGKLFLIKDDTKWKLTYSNLKRLR